MKTLVKENSQTIEDTLQAIQAYAKNPLGEMRVLPAVDVGYHVRQGDLYIERISAFDMTKYDVVNDRQLAPGSTQGSRHTVDGTVTVLKHKTAQQVLKVNDGYKMLGPVVESKERFTVSHPEHAAMSLPSGTYQISYQCDPSTLRRVLD